MSSLTRNEYASVIETLPRAAYASYSHLDMWAKQQPTHSGRNDTGFTIVELLIIIVVIGILAALTIVAYNGIQSRAQASAVSSVLSQTSKKLALYAVDNGAFPADLATIGITNANTTTFQYTVNNSATPQTYCVTATNGTTSYKSSSAAPVPVSGGCVGHGIGGVAPITNLARNPKGIGGASGWFVPLTSDATDTANVTWGARTDWHRLVWSGVGNSTIRLRVALSDLVNGQTYYSSVLLANSGTVSISGSLDFSDQGTTTFTLAPNETRRVGFSAARATYDAVYSFLDISLASSAASGYLVTDVMITDGATARNYADGTSTNWVWNGTANASTSTGPPL